MTSGITVSVLIIVTFWSRRVFSGNGNWGEWINGACSTTCETGEQNRTRQCDNPPPDSGSQDCVGDSWEIVNCDPGVCAVQNFQLQTPSELLFRSDDSTLSATFMWEKSPDLTASVVIISDNNITVPVSPDNVYNNGSFSVTPNLLTSTDYGVYHVQLELANTNGKHIEDMALYYEEPIIITKVQTPPEVVVETPMELTAILSSGSNVGFDWITNENDSAWTSCANLVRECKTYFNYTNVGEFNITLVANNEVSSGVVTDIIVAVYNPVEGFNLTLRNAIINGNKSAAYILTLDRLERLPMGNLTLNMNFGDGESVEELLNDNINTALSPGYTLSHVYSEQGNFTSTANISSGVSIQHLPSIAISVWDNISQLHLSVPEFANVSEPIQFEFKNHFSFGFNFKINYGDGETTESPPNILSQLFDSTSWNHTYSSPGIYTIELEAWNAKFHVNCEYKITIQYPITSLAIIPAAIPILQYPLPDGNITFKITQQGNFPAPTNVTCKFSFENGEESKTESANISYSQPLLTSYGYTTTGRKDINITCINVVSYFTVLTQIDIKSVTLEDISITYPLVTSVNMSRDTNNELESIAIVIPFNISLFNCERFPDDVSLVFNFGDRVVSDVTEFQVVHTFTKRGSFDITVTISSRDKSISKILPIKIGTMDFTVDKHAGWTGRSEFVFNISGPANGGSYELFTDNQTKFDLQSSSDPILKGFIYTVYGTFYPYIRATFSTFTEIVYLDAPIYTDFNLSAIEITFNTTIDSPPGDIVVTVTKHPFSVDLPNVKCIFDFDDKIDRKKREISQDITTDNPIEYHFKYLALGYANANFTCYNFYDRNENISIITVYNECFPMTGVFDRQYSNDTNPLRIYTSDNVDLASRMPVVCVKQNVQYEWMVFEVLNNTIRVANYTPPEKPLGSMRFTRIPKGLYKITLKVSLSETYLIEPTYCLFIKPPPVALINRGFQRQATMTTPIVQLDALTHSYEPDLGYGGNENLMFDWSCKRVPATNLAELFNKYELDNGLVDCMDLINTTAVSGKVELNLLNASYHGYAVTVNVTDGNLFTPFTQLILVVPGSPPLIFIECVLNCMAKYALTKKSIWRVQCTDCTPDEELTYNWHLWYKLNNDWVEIQDLSDLCSTGIRSATLALNPNSLQEDTDYKLTVTNVTGYGREGAGEAAEPFVTNLPPYGGYCEADPSIGNASTTGFNFFCYNWRDEGEERGRDSERDQKAKNPLKYDFSTVEYDEESVEQVTAFQSGNEESATVITLSIGDPNNNYTIPIRVQITDNFGDNSNIDLEVISKPPEEYLPKDSNDVGATENFFDDYNENFKKVDKGGNKMALFRLMESAVSIYIAVPLPTSTTPDISTPINCVNYKDDGEENSDVKNYLQTKTNEMVNIMNSKTPAEESIIGLPSTEANFIAKALRQSISNKALMTGGISQKVSENALKVMKNVKKRTNLNPLPLSETSGIKGAAKEVVSVLSGVLSFWMTAGTEEITELTMSDVEDFFQDYYFIFPDKYHEEIHNQSEHDDFVQKCFYNKKKLIEKQRTMANATKDGADNMIGSVKEALDSTAKTISPGEREQVINTTELTLSVEKDSKEAFLNKSVVTRNGMSLKLDNESLSNVTDTNMELQVSTFDKSPFRHAGGAGKITGKVFNIDVKDESGNKIEMPLNIDIINEGVTHFKEHTPHYDPGDPDRIMHFKVKLRDTSDAMILYLRLDDETRTSITTRDIYICYVRAKLTPTTSSYNFKTIIQATDYDEYGYKVFVAGWTVEGGDVFIGIKALGESEDDSTTPLPNSRRKRSANQNDTLSFNGGSNTTDLETANISVAVVTTGCKVYDSSSNTWKPNGCSVLPFSTLNETVCSCPPAAGSIFSLSFATPNMIDFSSVFSKFDPTNAVVYGTLIGILVVYFILAVILRRKDQKDTIRSIPTFLCDNEGSDNYFYMLAVHTGLRPGAGTRSNVCFILAGENHDSGVRLLSDGDKKGFEANSVNFYIMSTPRFCGDLNYIRVWHDNSGDGNTSSWYLHKIVVTDLQTEDRYIFHCDKWFAIDMDDGMIDRVIPVVSNKECPFETAFSQQSRANVTENHLWLSLVMRPQKNAFTRLQRLSCLLMLLFLTMITNAMFFTSSEDDAVTPDTVQIGSFRLSLKVVYVSFIGCIITVPPIFLATYLYRNASAKEIKKKHKTSNNTNADQPVIIIHQKKKFPHWVVYIAWFVVALAVVTSAFFLLLYSMQWGKEKSAEWMTTFVLSFVESVFLVDPFKVIIVAVLIAFIMRKPVEDEKLTVDLNTVKKQAKCYQPSDKSQFLAFRMEVMAKGGPPSATMMEEQRQKAFKQKEAKQAFTRLLLHIFFAAILFCMSYINRDQRAYLHKAHVDNQLFVSSKYQYGFSKITSPAHFFEWNKRTLIPMLYPTSEYNGDPIGVQDKFFIGDMANLRLGLVRLRQIKVKKAECFTPILVSNHFCARKYDGDIEETADLCTSCSTPLTTDAWKYTSALEIWGIPTIGLYNTYGGGGYIQSFSNIKANTEDIINELYENSWIDRLTRAVFVEFALYNANINVVCYSIFLVEFPETGGTLTWADTQCFRPTLITSATGAFNLLLNIFFLLLILVRIVSMFKLLKKQKCKFFKNFWIILDIFIVLMSFIGVGIWITKYIFTKKALDMYAEDTDSFINFQHVVAWEYAFSCLLAFLVFVATIRVSSALGYNRRITEIADVLRQGSSAILGFGSLFLIIFFAFVMFAYLMFGIALYEYRNLFISFGSLLNTIIGKNSLGKMQQAVPIFAEAYFFVYVFFVVFTLLTMFAAILNNTIVRVRRQNKNQPGPVGITDVLFGTFRDMLGLVGIHMRKSKKKSGYKSKQGYTGPVSTAKVVDLVRETLSDAIDEDALAKKESRRLGKECHDNLLRKRSPVIFVDDSYTPACTPQQITMEFRGNKSPNNDQSKYLFTL